MASRVWPGSAAACLRWPDQDGGAGKTVLARQLSDVLQIPVVHLDQLYDDQDRQARPAEEFVAAQRHALTAEKIILDGNHAATLPVRLAVADTVILLDLPAWTCPTGIARRRWRYRGGQHADGVFDRVTVGFVRYVIGYRRRMIPRVLAMLTDYPDLSMVRLTSRRQVRRFLHDLGAGSRAARACQVAPRDRA